jgi:hypothetical protein
MLYSIIKSVLSKRPSANDINSSHCGKYCIVRRSDGRLFRGFIQAVRIVKSNKRHMLTVRVPGEGYKNVYLDDLVYTFVK